jgi:hypothetical protein
MATPNMLTYGFILLSLFPCCGSLVPVVVYFLLVITVLLFFFYLRFERCPRYPALKHLSYVRSEVFRW